MTDTHTDPGPLPSAAADALVDRLFGATLGALELLSVYLGWRLDLYRSLATDGPATPGQLAEQASIDERYAREWLEQQAAAGILAVEDPTAAAGERRFSLPPGHEAVLVDPTDLSHLAPFAAIVVGIADALPEVVDAYRTGAGVPYVRYGADFRDGQGAINRPAFHHDLANWMEALPDLDHRLRTIGARVVDLGCGQGWSTIALARAYPHADVVGIDTDQASVADAVLNAGSECVTVRFRTDDRFEDGSVDLVCVFEALHDMADPVAVLRLARGWLAPGGTVLVADERVADTFHARTGEVERMMYGWSVLHCLPVARADSPSAALGTVLRPAVVDHLAAQAGFASVRALPIDHDFFRFYRLDP